MSELAVAVDELWQHRADLLIVNLNLQGIAIRDYDACRLHSDFRHVTILDADQHGQRRTYLGIGVRFPKEAVGVDALGNVRCKIGTAADYACMRIHPSGGAWLF